MRRDVRQICLWPQPVSLYEADTAPQTAPFVAGCDTSEEAARSIEPHLSALQRKVLNEIEFHEYDPYDGGDGLTCDEIEHLTDLKHQTVSARIRELREKGLIEDRGERRPTRSGRKAIVWRLVK